MSTFTVSTESRGFLLISIVGSAAGLALTITNAVYYSQARNNCNSISTTTANVMMWLNIILAVIFGIILIWAFYRLVVHPDLRKELGRQTNEYFAGKPDQPLTARRVGIAPTAPTVSTQQVPLAPVVSSGGLRETSAGVAGNVVTGEGAVASSAI